MSGEPPRPKSKVSGLFGIASGLKSTPPPAGQVSPLFSLPQPKPAAQAAAKTEPALRYVPGGVIGEKYRLTRILGEGGMGAVWVARNLRLEVDVAIKLIRHELAAEGTADRLLVEAQSAARIGHPSIVRIYDFGETDYKDPYIVMELLEGESLRQALDRKFVLPPTNAIQTLLPVAGALEAAHAKGIVHRDVKPENVLLSTGERGLLVPKVVDFGIAKLQRSSEGRRSKTEAGSVLGSPDYMSPEQARGRDDIDERTDIWSLAVVIYETLTGACPFQEPNYHAQLRAIIETPPAPIWERGVAEPELWDVLARGLAKDRDERWPTMRAFGAALAQWLIGEGVETDIAGAMLTMTWTDAPSRRVLSEPPPRDQRISRVPELREPSGDALEVPSEEGEDEMTMMIAPRANIAWPVRPSQKSGHGITATATATGDAATAEPALGRAPPPDIEIVVDRMEDDDDAPTSIATMPESIRELAAKQAKPLPVVPPPTTQEPATPSAPPTPISEPSSSRRDAAEARAPVSAQAIPAAVTNRRSSGGRGLWVLVTLALITAGGAVAVRTTPQGAALFGRVLVAAGRAPATKPTPTAAPTHARKAAAPAPRPTATAAPSASSTASTMASASASTDASATPSAMPAGSASASASASASSGPPPPSSGAPSAAPAAVAGASSAADPAACIAADLPPESLNDASASRVAALCQETDPRKGAINLKTELVIAARHRRVTDAMREWAVMSWFELAAFAAVRADCCPGAEPLKLPPVGGCEPLDSALQGVGEAAASGGALEPSMVKLHKAIGCITVSGAANNYPFTPLTGGEETALKKTLARIAARHGR